MLRAYFFNETELIYSTAVSYADQPVVERTGKLYIEGTYKEFDRIVFATSEGEAYENIRPRPKGLSINL